jgi:predicted DNA-binding transcriptional regulator YafY
MGSAVSTASADGVSGAAGAPDTPAHSAAIILVMLQEAVRERRRVLLGYVDRQGTPSNRIVRPTAMDGGWLTAWDERSGGPRRFVLHRVTGVSDVGDAFAEQDLAGVAWIPSSSPAEGLPEVP